MFRHETGLYPDSIGSVDPVQTGNSDPDPERQKLLTKKKEGENISCLELSECSFCGGAGGFSGSLKALHRIKVLDFFQKCCIFFQLHSV